MCQQLLLHLFAYSFGRLQIVLLSFGDVHLVLDFCFAFFWQYFNLFGLRIFTHKASVRNSSYIVHQILLKFCRFSSFGVKMCTRFFSFVSTTFYRVTVLLNCFHLESLCLYHICLDNFIFSSYDVKMCSWFRIFDLVIFDRSMILSELSSIELVLTLLLLSTTCPVLANSVDPDQLASEEANWSGSALFVMH